MKRDSVASPTRAARVKAERDSVPGTESDVSSPSEGRDAQEDRMKEAKTEATKGNGRAAAALPALSSVLEAILFATDKPVTIEQLRYALPEAEPEAIERTLIEMERRYVESGAGYRLYRLAGGVQLRTAPELHTYVERFLVGKRRSRLSRAALETLAAVAYRQPITRGDLEDLRGVDCGQVLHTLMERSLVASIGRSEALGRPLIYGTTDEFLTYFGLTSLSDLPSLEEFQSLLGDDPLQDPEIREALVSEGLWDEPAEPLAAPELTLIVSGADGEEVTVVPHRLSGDGEALADEVDGEEVLLGSPWEEDPAERETPQHESGAILSADDETSLSIDPSGPKLRDRGRGPLDAEHSDTGLLDTGHLDTGLDEATLDEDQDEEDPRLDGGSGVPPTC